MKRRNRAVYKTIRGVNHKLCSGPAHREGKFVSVHEFFLRKDGRLRPQCKHCESVNRGAERMVPYSEINFAVQELVFRLGKAEAARRIGVKTTTMWEWTTGKRKRIHRDSARRIVLVLVEARRNGEARHRKSIKHGASLRGREEKIPLRTQDFNGKNDQANEYRRENRQKNIEHAREQWRQAAAKKRAARKAERLTDAA